MGAGEQCQAKSCRQQLQLTLQGPLGQAPGQRPDVRMCFCVDHLLSSSLRVTWWTWGTRRRETLPTVKALPPDVASTPFIIDVLLQEHLTQGLPS